MSRKTTKPAVAPPALLEFAEIGLHKLELEWLKIINNRPGMNDDQFRRLKQEPVVVKLLDDIERAKAAIKFAKTNARLIAAAPDLLAVAKWIAAADDAGPVERMRFRAAALTAIAKVEGKP